MTLEFNKIIEDIERMGRFLAYRDREDLIQKALAILFDQGTDMDFIQERVRMVRESDVSGYRGAAPLEDPQPFHEAYAHGDLPPSATIIAADGSQIYPSYEAPSLYYLLNIGVLVYPYGTGELPLQVTHPSVYYTDTYMLDEYRNLISNRTVNSRRTMLEIEVLRATAYDMRGEARPLVALHDGNLLKFFAGSDVTDSGTLMNDYMGLLVGMQDLQVVFAGYVDTPRSSYLISLLHLLDLPESQIDDVDLGNNGDLEGLNDADIFERILEPGQRSALMVQNSPQNLEYKKINPSHEIAVCYINVSGTSRPHIARIDMPMWVARNQDAVEELHALVLSQCAIQRTPYPYALTRADELATVSAREKNQVEDLVRRELLKNNAQGAAQSAKTMSKNFAREAFRTDHRLGDERQSS